MENNIIKIGNVTAILNGGNPLPGCPESWEQAYEIEKQLNNGVTKDDDDYNSAPRWDFDCGFKLDFDGPLMHISSRFYPPKTHYGATWDGTVTVYILDKEVSEKKFDCKTLDELKQQVEEYVYRVANKLIDAIK